MGLVVAAVPAVVDTAPEDGVELQAASATSPAVTAMVARLRAPTARADVVGFMADPWSKAEFVRVPD